MAYNTTTSQGAFTGTGQPVFLPFPSGVDWLEVRNLTQINAAANPASGVEFFWQRNFPSVGGVGGAGIEIFNTAGTQVMNMTFAPNLFFPLDTTNPPVNPELPITGSSNAVQPIILAANTANLFTGSIVRLNSIAAQPNLSGYDFSIDTVNNNANFRIKNPLANAPGAAGTQGFYQLISSFAPTATANVPYWYPSSRRIVNITKASPAVITTSVDSAYVAGQSIRLVVPSQFGMTQADGLLVNVISVNGGAVTVALDSTGFTAFTFPLAAAYPFTPAQTIPVGEETDQFSNPNLLDDATINTGQTGLVLMGGIGGPAGQANDIIFWIGGKTFNGS